MVSIKQYTIWVRGVIQDKEGRDFSNGIAAAGLYEGKFTQAFDNYVDLPDRVNVPLRATPDGAVEVRGPPRCTVAQAHEVLSRHAGWLARTLPRVRESVARRPTLADGTGLSVLERL